MLHLEHDQLKFTFPEIARQLRALLEQYLRQVSDKFRLPQDRTKLGEAIIREVELGWRFRLRHGTYESVCLAAQSLTEADVEEALRESAYEVTRVHDDSLATVQITFQRTLRIPDDGKMYPLPAGLGRFPLRSVDDFAATAPPSWLKRGGIVMPMYQSEALWIDFSSSYPFAVKVAAGKINAVSGEPWSPDLQQEPQNYLVLPDQPWLDGFAVGEGVIRQFVAMPLGAGHTVEEQLTGQADVGGMQLQAYPMCAKSYFRDQVIPSLPSSLVELFPRLFADYLEENLASRSPRVGSVAESMGLGAGGKMRQEIYEDAHDFEDWDQTQTSRCFVHLCNSFVWRQVTGANPPHPPFTIKEYKRASIPWFDYYRGDQKALKGSKRLAEVKSIATLGEENNNQPLPDNSSIAPELVVQYGSTRRPGIEYSKLIIPPSNSCMPETQGSSPIGVQRWSLMNIPSKLRLLLDAAEFAGVLPDFLFARDVVEGIEERV